MPKLLTCSVAGPVPQVHFGSVALSVNLSVPFISVKLPAQLNETETKQFQNSFETGFISLCGQFAQLVELSESGVLTA